MELPVRHGHAGSRALACKADDVFGTDVRREDRCTNHDPAGASPCQKVILLVFLMAAVPPSHPPNEGEVESNDDPVKRCHLSSFREIALWRGTVGEQSKDRKQSPSNLPSDAGT